MSAIFSETHKSHLNSLSPKESFNGQLGHPKIRGRSVASAVKGLGLRVQGLCLTWAHVVSADACTAFAAGMRPQ